jgi:gliding motility-associated-like protein
MPDLELQVMDRNGFLLYSGTSGWDGTYKGKPMDPDTYFYLVKYGDRQKIEHTKKGYITLVR